MADLRFLIIFDQFNIDERDVRSGNNVTEVIVASRCVNVGLFISGDLRRNVEVNIAWEEAGDLFVIAFPGKDLKRVSPDERSIAFFLLKARQALENLSSGQRKVMDNGIEIKRTSLDALVDSWDTSKVFAAMHDGSLVGMMNTKPSGVFVYREGTEKSELSLSHLEVIPVPKPPTPERFILDINLESDR